MFVRIRSRTHRVAIFGLLGMLSLVSWRTWARPLGLLEPPRPQPDIVNLRYGPYDRNVLDVWKAKSKSRGESSTPLVVFFHGGGFRSGDKSIIPAWLVSKCLDAGISVASANYRLSQTAPFPAPMRDGARAIQFLRFKAKELGIDPTRIAASGSSAGAGIALWVGFHDDLAEPQSLDPIARQSSRVTCLGVDGAQTSYDPRFIKSLIGGRAHEHSALKAFYGITSDAELDTPKAHELFEAASPLTYASAGDPPVILFYKEPNVPLTADARPGEGIHHPRFGEALKSKLGPLQVECVLRHSADFPRQVDPNEMMFGEMLEFFARQFDKPRRPALEQPKPAINAQPSP
jgi:acetyl esterase